MTTFEAYSLLISSLTALTTLVALIYAGIQLKALYRINSTNHDWNRRMAAQAALKGYNQSTLTSALQNEFDYLNCREAIPLEKIQNGFENHPSLQSELHQLLNVYESFARGVSQGIYDKNVIKEARRGSMIKALHAFDSYIKDRRKTSSPRAWSELDSLVARWLVEEKDTIPRQQTDA